MNLTDLPRLVDICGNESFSDYFPFNELSFLEVKRCWSLRSIFTVSNVKILEKLQELRIMGCESMDQVIEWKTADCSTEGTSKIVFPQLSLLMLYGLTELRSFCSRCTTHWPSLTEMKIQRCDRVKAFVADSDNYCEPLFLLEQVAFPKMTSLKISSMSGMTELWNISKEGKDLECSSDAFPKLKTLDVSSCGQLSTIFPSKMVRKVQKLEELSIIRCDSVKQVFQLQGIRSKRESIDNYDSITISFSLKKLEISYLQALDHVWDVDHGEGIVLSLGELQEIRVNSCSPHYLFPASIVKYLNKLKKISVTNCENMVEIVKKSSTGDNSDECDHAQFVPFVKVTTLLLGGLLNLKTLIICGESSEWPSLKFIMLTACPEAKLTTSRRQKMRGGCDNIASIRKEDILINLKAFITDMKGLREMPSSDGFVNVAHLIVIGDHDETFRWKLLERFHGLEMLSINGISTVELFPSEDEEADGHAKEENEIVPYRCNNNQNPENKNLPRLRELLLSSIENLQQVYKEASTMAEVLSIVKKLRVEGCASLKYLFSTAASFNNLVMIDVCECGKMEYLLTTSAARCLGQLSILHISDCESMEEIVIQDQDGDGSGGASKVDSVICFPRLKELRLSSLENLTSFSHSQIFSFEFCFLESVCLDDLPNLEVFCKRGFTAPLLHDIDVSKNESSEEANWLKALMEQIS